MKKCIIIGSGLGGLSSGVILAKNGYDVTILEQASQMGGCLQCFWRDGVKFETGMHFIGSMEDGQVLSNYFNCLEIKDKIELRPLDPTAYNVVRLHGENFAFPNGREAFIERFSERFPSQRDNLVRYCDIVERVAATSPYYDLSKEQNSARFFDDESFFSSINEVIDKTISDPLLRDVLVGDLPLYDAQKDKTSFATHAYITKFYNQGSYRIVGGSDNVAKALYNVLTNYGGRVLTRQKVTKINVSNSVATSVETSDGHLYEADVVVSGIHPSQLVDLVEEHAFSKAYRSRVKSFSNAESVFSLFLRFKENTMPYMNHNYFSYSSDSPWEMYSTFDSVWPKGYLYMHHCHDRDSEFAEAGVVISYLSMDVVKKWDGTRIGRRGAEYEQLKTALAEQLLDAVERDFPNIRESIAGYYSATPLTYQDYTLTPDGSIYGLTKDVRAGVTGRVSFKTKVSNLFLVGQNINSHGILGVTVGSLIACSHIVGEEVIDRQMRMANRKKTLIIGGGLGGLFTGALLTKEGYHVTVLEKNKTIGGSLQTFKRGGITFDTGMHMIGGLRPGGSIHMLLTYLGIYDQLKIRRSDADCMDSITYLEDGKTYRIPEGRETFAAYFIQEFPHEEEGIRNYVDAIYRLADEIDLFHMRPTESIMTRHSEQFLWAADELISYYIKDERLRDILAYMNPMYGGVYGHTPAYIHAIINVLYISGQDRFMGNSQQLADVLARLIVKGGGDVVSNECVSMINVDDERYCTSVDTVNGNHYSADYYISAIHPQRLVELVSRGGFPKSYCTRVASIPNTYSAFIVFVKFRPATFPYINHTCYYQDEYGKVWSHGEYDPTDEKWPHGFMYMTPATEQDDYASSMVINCLMPYSAVKQWEGTQPGHRGKDYDLWKQRNVELILRRMEQLHPGFHDTIDQTWSSSPLTIHDYYGQPEGSLYGIQKDCKDIILSRLPIGTKVKNLLLTGQNINVHGFCGVPLTAINTVEALIGQNRLINKINQFYTTNYGNHQI